VKRIPWWIWVIGVVIVAGAFLAGLLAGMPDANGPDTVEPDGEPTGAVDPPDDGEAPPEPADDDDDGAPPDSAEPQYVRIYLVRDGLLGTALREIPATQAVATAAIRELLGGLSEEERAYGLTSAVPDGTELLGIEIEDGTARVDLSGGFDDGGGTLSMSLRLGQVVFTLTQFSTVQRVELWMDGAPVEVFGGEGLIIDAPMTRGDFEEVLPALFVEGPTPGASVTSPVRVWGTGNTFEAAFLVRVEDPTGATLVELPAMATSGTGTRGTFDLTVSFATTVAGMGKVVVWEASARDGSPINVIEIPVQMSP
jgi:hypothetical protein